MSHGPLNEEHGNAEPVGLPPDDVARRVREHDVLRELAEANAPPRPDTDPPPGGAAQSRGAPLE